MKESEKCKVIQDLLPIYIEKLTSNETNEYIENHLKECDECTKILTDMGENIILDKIDDIKKIDYLKKIKYRNRLIIGTIFAISISLIIVIISFFNSIGGVAIDENGKPEYYEAFKKWMTGKDQITISKVTNILLKTSENNLETTIIMTFDKNDICIGARYCLDGYTEEELLDRYNNFKNVENGPIPTIVNVVMKENKLIYNYNYWNGKNKEEILKELNEKYVDFIIQEI